MRGLVGCLLVAVGCGSSGEQAHDARVADTASSDALIDAAPSACDVTKPFGNAQPLAGVNTTSDELYGWLTPDELTIYFTSTATGSADRDIYVGTRADTSSPFVGVKKLPGVSTTGTEQRPVLSSDGKTLYGDSGVDIIIATRANTTDDFGAFAPLAEVNSGAADVAPWVTTDGRTMYLSSLRDTTGTNHEIFRATRSNATDPWGTPQVVAELGASDYDGSPVLSADGLEIFIESQRSAAGTTIYHATRTSTADPFGTPEQVAELDTTGPEAPSWLSADRCRLVYSRQVTANAFDLWIASRPK